MVDDIAYNRFALRMLPIIEELDLKIAEVSNGEEAFIFVKQ